MTPPDRVSVSWRYLRVLLEDVAKRRDAERDIAATLGQPTAEVDRRADFAAAAELAREVIEQSRGEAAPEAADAEQRL